MQTIRSSFGLDRYRKVNFIAYGYFAVLLVMSVVAFAAFGIDKRRARLDKNRIPEKRLHLYALLGGWPGALLGQRWFRHKTIKLSFRFVLWLIVAVHVMLIAGWFWILLKT